MSNFKSKLARRIMAIVLSGAMVMSNMSAYAAELTPRETEEVVETVETDTEDNDNEDPETPEVTNRGGEEGGEGEGGESTPTPQESQGAPESSEAQKAPESSAAEESSKTVESSAAEESSKTVESSEDEESSKTIESSEAVSEPESESVSGSETESEPGSETGSESESETASDEVRMINLSDGLKAKTATGTEITYGDEDILTLKVLEDMDLNISDGITIVSGMEWNGFVKGANSASPKNGNIPTAGAAFKIDAKKDAKIYFVTKAAAKTYHFLEVSVSGTTETKGDDITETAIPGGTLSFTLEAGKRYYFYADGSKPMVYGIGYIAYDKDAEPVDWADVAAPAISNIKTSDDGKRINMTVDGVIGAKGGDKLTVEMFDSANSTTPVSTAETVLDKAKRTISFEPKATGRYVFKATLSRKTDDTTLTKVSAVSDPYTFAMPLAKPAIDKVTNIGGGSVEIALKSAIAEATGYKVTAYSDTACETVAKEVTGTAEDGATTVVLTMEGLTVGETYYFKAMAVRTIDSVTDYSEESDAVGKIITAESEVEEEEEIGTKYVFDAAKELGESGLNLEKNAIVEAGQKFADDYFVVGISDREVTEETPITKAKRANSGTYSLEVGKKLDSFIQFTTSGTASVELEVSSNGGTALSSFGIIDKNGNIVAPVESFTDGANKIKGSDKKKFTYKDLPVGTYRIGSPDLNDPDETGKRGVRIYTITVVEMPAGLSADIDISQGLKAGQVYGSTDLATLEVLEDMPASALSEGKEIGGVTYNYSIQGKVNPDPKGGAIPTKGAVFKITAYKETTVTFVTGKADGKVWHVVRDDEKEVLKGNAIPEGTIKFRAQEGRTYYFYGDGTKVKAYAISMEEYVYIPRGDWATIAPPVITGAEVKTKDGANVIEVTVTGDVSNNGGDEISVEMYDAEGDPETVVTTKSSTTAGKTTTLTFSPSSSGVYYFKAFLSRNAEASIEDPDEDVVFDDKESNRYPAEGGVEFAYLLQAPLIDAVTNLGNGAIEVDWGKASEATGYEVVVTDAQGKSAGTPNPLTTNQTVDEATGKVTAAETIGEISGLTVGEKYKVKVRALRDSGEEGKDPDTSAWSSETEVTITQGKQIKWAFSASGSSTSIKKGNDKKFGYGANTEQPKNGFHKEGTADNNFDVEVWSLGGAGKVVPATTDGLAFYYTEIKDPENTNFTLTAKAYIESWTYSNGQDGFGLMASDTVGENGNGDYVWTNCYQNVVSKIEFRWDGTQPADYADTTMPRYSMKLGVGATEKLGATAKDIEDIWSGAISQPALWTASQYPIDYSMTNLPAGTYNIAGNCTNSPEGTSEIEAAGLLRTEFDLSIQKNNNGYKLSYTNVVTGETTEKQFYGTDVLNNIESDKIYVGVFAGRNADVTFKNVNLRTYPTTEDPEAEEPEPNYVNLISTISSPATTNTSDYDLVFTSNWDGELVIRNSDNVVVGKTDVTGTLDTAKALLEDGDNDKDTKAHVTLSGLAIGSNVFTATFTPNKHMKNEPANTALNDYAPVTLTHTVDYRKYGDENSILYVAPNGKSSGTGTKANPLDVYTAIKYVQPGQKIFLAGGRYELNKTISIARGINGEKDKMIYMMADPEATERPVFDFNKKVTGMTMGGDYWYFKGFDVTRSLDGQKGIQVSGSNNVLDQIQTYMNGNTGIQVSGSGNDTYRYWPQNNLILNCTSYLNSDHGYEDADGFAAKLTIGSGNVFDGCIAAYNADDGWDLFAKIESGQIGSVTIRNSIAYKNGYVLVDANGNLSLKGEETNAGNGNGFKMGGDGLPGGSKYDLAGDGTNTTYLEKFGKYKGHSLENSLAFENKSKGFDSNSCPNNKIKNSISFNNKGGNVELYTYNNVQETDYEVQNVISFRTKYTGVIDSVSPKGTQKTDKSAFRNKSTYLWSKRPRAGINVDNIRVNKSWFKSVKFEGTKDSNYVLFARNADGSINRNGFMEIDTEKMQADIISQGTTMDNIGLNVSDLGIQVQDPALLKTDADLIGDSKETPGDISAGNSVITDDDNSGLLADEELEYANAHGINVVPVLEEGVSYTGLAVKPEIRVYLNGSLFTDYSVSYKNNINAYVEGDENYKNIPDAKRPQMILKLKNSYMNDYIYYFDIKPVDVNDKSKVAAPSIAVEKAQVPKVALTFNGKSLALGKDFDIYTETITKVTETDENGAEKEVDKTVEELSNKKVLSASTTLKVKGIGNYTGTVDVPFIMTSESAYSGLLPMSKANVKVAVNAYNYTGSEILPDITVDGTAIAKSEDGKSYADNLYDVSIASGKEIGKATATITAKAIVPPESSETESSGGDTTVTTPTAKYVGSKTVAFTIKVAPIKLDNIVFVSQEKDSDGNYKTSTGKNIVFEPLKYTGSARALAGEFKVVIDGVTYDGISKGSRNVNDPGTNTLYKYNYTYEYKNNIEAGSANVIIKGIHNCTGSVALKFKIDPQTVADTDIKQYRKAYTETDADGKTTIVTPEKLTGKGLEIVYDYDVTYVSSGAKPTVSIYFNGNGISKKNYNIAYKNNKNAGDTAQAIITWGGGLKGTKPTTLEYKISKCKFENSAYVKSISDVFTNGQPSMKAAEFDKSRAVVMNAKTKLAPNRDYTLEFEYDEYDSNLETVKEPVVDNDGNPVVDEDKNPVMTTKRAVYDTSNKDAKKNVVYVPETGLDVAVYIKPVTGGRFDNYEITDGDRVKVADIRVAYYDIAKANIKLIDPVTGKNAILYFKDVTELSTINSNGINRLDQKYIKIYHSAYAKVHSNGSKDDYLNYINYATRKGDGYTYNVNATDAVKAGSQKVTFYGTGLFGGSKVFKYKLEKKTYDISKALVDTKTGIYIASDEYLALTDDKIPAALKASIEEQLTSAFEGKITGVNGLNEKLPSGYYVCTYDEKDIKNCKAGKPITVIIKGTNSYSGIKTVKIAAKLVSSDLGKASASAVDVEASKDDIADGIVLGKDTDALNTAIAGKLTMDGYTLTYGVDYTVNDAAYIAFAKDDNGEYIVDASGETMIGEDGEVKKDESGNPIKYKVLRKYTGYDNNKKVSTEEAPAYVCLKGIGNFSGVLEVQFTIKEAEEKPAEQ